MGLTPSPAIPLLASCAWKLDLQRLRNCLHAAVVIDGTNRVRSWQPLLLGESAEQADVVGVLLPGRQSKGVDPSSGREVIAVMPLRKYGPARVRYNDVEV